HRLLASTSLTLLAAQNLAAPYLRRQQEEPLRLLFQHQTQASGAAIRDSSILSPSSLSFPFFPFCSPGPDSLPFREIKTGLNLAGVPWSQFPRLVTSIQF